MHEFLEPLELSQSEFARHLNIPIQRVNELVRGKRGVTPDTAWLLSESLGTSPEFCELKTLDALQELGADIKERPISNPTLSAEGLDCQSQIGQDILPSVFNIPDTTHHGH